MTKKRRNKSGASVTKKQKQHIQNPTKQRKKKLGWWKFYVPFFTVVFLLHFKFWHAEQEWVFKTLFPSDHKEVATNILIILFPMMFIPFLTYMYKHRDRWKLKWYHPEYLGVGFIFCAIPTAFLGNVLFVLMMWLNSLSATATYQQEYRAKVVQIHKKKHSTPMRHSGSGWVNNFPYTRLFVCSIGDNKPYHGIYTSFDSGHLLEQIDDLRLIVQQKDGWLGFGVIESISIAADLDGDSVSTFRSSDSH